MSTKPIIGITLDYAENDKSYSHYPWYALRADYADAVAKAGGIALMLPYQLDAIDNYINLCDGLIVSGGDFDIDPKFYGDSNIHDKVAVNSKRTQFEHQLMHKFLASQKPIMGVCGGEQLLNVIMGGSLIQHIPDEIEGALNHEQDHPKYKPTHSVSCKPNTLLNKLVNKTNFMVNTTHHQSVKRLGDNLLASAVAPDGVIEAIELKDHPFCLGVQWHPEFYKSDEDKAIMCGFIKACQ